LFATVVIMAGGTVQPGRSTRQGSAGHAAAISAAAQRGSRDYVRADEIRQREKEAEAFLASITGGEGGQRSRAQSTSSASKIRWPLCFKIHP